MKMCTATYQKYIITLNKPGSPSWCRQLWLEDKVVPHLFLDVEPDEYGWSWARSPRNLKATYTLTFARQCWSSCTIVTCCQVSPQRILRSVLGNLWYYEQGSVLLTYLSIIYQTSVTLGKYRKMCQPSGPDHYVGPLYSTTDIYQTEC